MPLARGSCAAQIDKPSSTQERAVSPNRWCVPTTCHVVDAEGVAGRSARVTRSSHDFLPEECVENRGGTRRRPPWPGKLMLCAEPGLRPRSRVGLRRPPKKGRISRRGEMRPTSERVVEVSQCEHDGPEACGCRSTSVLHRQGEAQKASTGASHPRCRRDRLTPRQKLGVPERRAASALSPTKTGVPREKVRLAKTTPAAAIDVSAPARPPHDPRSVALPSRKRKREVG